MALEVLTAQGLRREMIAAAERVCAHVLPCSGVYGAGLYGYLAEGQETRRPEDIDIVFVVDPNLARRFRALRGEIPDSAKESLRQHKLSVLCTLLGLNQHTVEQILHPPYHSTLDPLLLPFGWTSDLDALRWYYRGNRQEQFGREHFLETVCRQFRPINLATGHFD